VRALISSTDPGKTFDLRCEVREGLIQFLCCNYPESLPRVRNVNIEEETQYQKPRFKQTSGKEHERGDKSPGVHADEKSDGTG
jgi:hypothetical protein